jgi:hypothetical protein
MVPPPAPAQQQCRRKEDPLLEVLNTLLVDVASLRHAISELAALRPHFDEHIKQEELFQKNIIDMATEAFADGDPVAHRLEHEARRDRARLCKAFWNSLLSELGKKTVFSLLAVAGALIAYWVSGHQIMFTNAPK